MQVKKLDDHTDDQRKAWRVHKYRLRAGMGDISYREGLGPNNFTPPGQKNRRTTLVSATRYISVTDCRRTM